MDGADGRETLEHEAGAATAGAPVRLGALLVTLINADDPGAPSARHRLEGRDEVEVGRGDAGGPSLRRGHLAIGLDDRYASGRHLRLVRQGASWLAEDQGSTNGTFVDGELLGRGERRPLGPEALLEVGHTFLHFRAEALGAADTPVLTAPARRDGHEPATLHPAWALELDRILRLAPTLHAVLVEGPSGAGKEVLARQLHERSGRPGPLVALNCGALAEDLLDDELFGHVKGAYSGAAGDRQGLIRAAHRGTLFLDEIGEMPPPLQVKLLRVLEDRLVRPLGAEAQAEVDVRVIAATHRDLGRLVAEGRFRGDLLARLGLLSVRVPALRERREDLGILVRAILRAAPPGPEPVRFDLLALRRLLLHPWPLNVRELRQALHVALDLVRGAAGGASSIALSHLPPAVRDGAASPAPDGARRPEPAPGRPLGHRRARTLTAEELERRQAVVEALERVDGNVAAAARALGTSRTGLQRLMARLGIERGGVPGPGRPPD